MSGRWLGQFQARVAQVFERIRSAAAIGAPPRHAMTMQLCAARRVSGVCTRRSHAVRPR
ncbi:hypothetical protein FHR65_000065 [Xanthomonas arboricola]|uniref:Uncharacterized protein n=1 Tax=Xanthomonas arboricola TaxID=56448 RepID=A0AB73GQT8_9XANT|nr:hypothetical protein [Xanthomonas arboricola]